MHIPVMHITIFDNFTIIDPRFLILAPKSLFHNSSILIPRPSIPDPSFSGNVLTLIHQFSGVVVAFLLKLYSAFTNLIIVSQLHFRSRYLRCLMARLTSKQEMTSLFLISVSLSFS